MMNVRLRYIAARSPVARIAMMAAFNLEREGPLCECFMLS